MRLLDAVFKDLIFRIIAFGKVGNHVAVRGHRVGGEGVAAERSTAAAGDAFYEKPGIGSQHEYSIMALVDCLADRWDAALTATNAASDDPRGGGLLGEVG